VNFPHLNNDSNTTTNNNSARAHRGIPIGQLLIEQGVLDERQVAHILRVQKESHRPFGDLAERLYGINPRAVEAEFWASGSPRLSRHARAKSSTWSSWRVPPALCNATRTCGRMDGRTEVSARGRDGTTGPVRAGWLAKVKAALAATGRAVVGRVAPRADRRASGRCNMPRCWRGLSAAAWRGRAAASLV